MDYINIINNNDIFIPIKSIIGIVIIGIII